MAEVALDTNVLLYIFSGEAAKATQARELIAGGGVISVQVLNEFAAVSRRKFKAPWPAVYDGLSALRANLRVEPLTVGVHSRGMQIAERHQLAIYDALILAAAVEAGCSRLLSEDMQHGQIVDGVRIENPFL
ncbi:MAG TPA: PIN domain-containing protein [Phenylobacterium sp.]|nr:PIN domain-containing protein [Phenylobacterium sp.]